MALHDRSATSARRAAMPAACIAALLLASPSGGQSCIDNGGCPPGTYCQMQAGDCDGIGQCVPIPDICPLIWDPVCGCDGVTYSNACVAAAAGVSVLASVPCDEVCTSDDACPPGMFCHRPVGDCDGPGECVGMPSACPLIWDPVCGCDGVTYSNDCWAAAAGVNVLAPVPCDELCASNDDCPPGNYCHKPDGDCDGPGVCTLIPSACVLIWDPVCGCDGVTYSNACIAALAGVSVFAPGVCSDLCTGNGHCPPDHYCQKPTGECDGEGECVPRPEICPFIWDPVCGCDNVTYGNSCGAAASGVTVFYDGPCCPEDLDGSGAVDFADVFEVIVNWGPCIGCPQDLNGNGDVDFADLLIVIVTWGPCG